MQEEELTNEARQHIAVIAYKQAHDKKSIAESQHEYINRARLTVCEVGIFLREIHNFQKYPQLPL